MFICLANKITIILIHHKIIEKEDAEIYQYGFEVLIYFIINLLTVLLVGVYFNRILHTLLFLSCYCTLRQFTGGYHADSYTRCTLTFILIYLVTIFLANSLEVNRIKIPLLIFLTLSYLMINRIAPLEHRNKLLSEKEKKHYKKVVIYLLKIFSIIIVVSLLLDIFIAYTLYLLFAIIWIAVLLMIGKSFKY